MKECCSNWGHFAHKSWTGLEVSWCNYNNDSTTSNEVCEYYSIDCED